MTVYSDYSKARVGWVLGLTGWQAGFLGVSFLPIPLALSATRYAATGLFLLLWLVAVFVTVTPIKGRSTVNWLLSSVSFAFGGLAGWTKFRSKASLGQSVGEGEADLPGPLQGIQIHDGPPDGRTFKRLAVIQNHTDRTWAISALVQHPGLGLCEADTRQRYGAGLSDLLDGAQRSKIVDEVILLVRTIPEDGVEREQWKNKHRSANGPSVSRQINDELQEALTRNSVRTVSYVTVVVSESRLAKAAKEAGGGLSGRAQILYAASSEMEALMLGSMGMSSVNWLTSPELALACRTGFAPGDRAGIVEALGLKAGDEHINADVPWSMAGPSGADPTPRHYSHDAWNSISSTIKLPTRGAAMGALQPVLTTQKPGERRSFMVAFPVMSASKADRQSTNSGWAADIRSDLRVKLKIKQKTAQADEERKARDLEGKVSRGSALIEPYAVVTVTVPKTYRVAAAGRDLDTSVRRAGFAPLRLDLSQDLGFTASTVPLGLGLNHRGI